MPTLIRSIVSQHLPNCNSNPMTSDLPKFLAKSIAIIILYNTYDRLCRRKFNEQNFGIDDGYSVLNMYASFQFL